MRVFEQKKGTVGSRIFSTAKTREPAIKVPLRLGHHFLPAKSAVWSFIFPAFFKGAVPCWMNYRGFLCAVWCGDHREPCLFHLIIIISTFVARTLFIIVLYITSDDFLPPLYTFVCRKISQGNTVLIILLLIFDRRHFLLNLIHIIHLYLIHFKSIFCKI